VKRLLPANLVLGLHSKRHSHHRNCLQLPDEKDCCQQMWCWHCTASGTLTTLVEAFFSYQLLEIVESLRGHLYLLMPAMIKMPLVECTVYCGITLESLDVLEQQYSCGRKHCIQRCSHICWPWWCCLCWGFCFVLLSSIQIQGGRSLECIQRLRTSKQFKGPFCFQISNNQAEQANANVCARCTTH
jgi:hypothetical protein